MEHFYSMDTDELEPIIKPKQVDFDTLSIEELNEYITNLEKEIDEKASTLIDLEDLQESMYKFPSQLSGGEQTRGSRTCPSRLPCRDISCACPRPC